MKKSILLVLLGLALLTSCDTKTPATPEFTVLKGATAYDGNGAVIKNSVVIIRGGKIEAIGDSSLDVPENSEEIDLSGKFLTPGVVDAHVHFGQTGFFDGRPDALDIRDTIDYAVLQSRLQKNPDRYYEAYLRSGVTAVYDVGGYPWSISFQTSAENNLNAPHVAAAGPLLTPVPDENLLPVNTPGQKQLLNLSSPEFGRQVVRQNSSLGSTGIKIWQINLEDPVFMDGLRAVVDEVARKENKLLVHATDLDQAKEALRLGAKILVHSVDDLPVDEEFIALAKQAGATYCPTLIVMRGYLDAYKSLGGEFVLRDPNNVVDAETKNLIQSAGRFFKYLPNPEGYEALLANYETAVNRREETMAENLKRVYQAGIPIAVSTDAGNPGTLHGISVFDEMEAMQRAGIPSPDILVMATRNGARTMGREDDFGTLEKGKMADLIILQEDPATDISNMRSITHVMRGGLLRPVDQPFDK
ncbi:MAG: amidohydrolase family protein [Robiginitalea sp.]